MAKPLAPRGDFIISTRTRQSGTLSLLDRSMPTDPGLVNASEDAWYDEGATGGPMFAFTRELIPMGSIGETPTESTVQCPDAVWSISRSAGSISLRSRSTTSRRARRSSPTPMIENM
jgi:hypothetical protein